MEGVNVFQLNDVYFTCSLDQYTKQQITPLFNNSDLRKNGVTLQLQILDRREPIKGVPAVYYV